MKQSSVVPLVFFYVILGLSMYSMWLLLAPFFTAIALAAVVVIVANPLHEKILAYVARGRASIAAFISTILVFAVVVTPIAFVSSVLVSEFIAFYQTLETQKNDALPLLSQLENAITQIVPGFDIDLTEPLQQSASWFGKSLGSVFSGAASAAITLLLSVMTTFYLFKDGPRLTRWLVHVSPLPDNEDTLIFNRITRAIRATITGTVALSIIQGVVATIGFLIFGIEKAVLWGSFGALGALVPGVGLLGVMVPALIYLFIMGNTGAVIGLAIYAVAAIIVTDNIIGPYLMSRGNSLHPLMLLLSVLGGISLFGPIGFIVGPVFVTIFLTLLELYNTYISPQADLKKMKK